VTAIDRLLEHLSNDGTGRSRALVVRRIGRGSVRVTVASAVDFDELAEADGYDTEGASAKLLWRTP